ncbi:MAG TPA: ABC transporter permease subunit [Acidimicrobiales bacterium]|nr:ABC transporter permease subunit [Acidimicrobiales bacterium]
MSVAVPDAATGGGAAAVARPARRKGGGRGGPNLSLAAAFLLPALLLLGALVLYPILFTIVRSLFDRGGDFTGLDNYREMFTSSRTLTAIRNTAIWVVVAPSVVTAAGLMFAVLSERVRWKTAFKVAVFMPMAISFLAAGVIFRLVYEQDPDRGLANAAISSVADVVREPGLYPGARPRDDSVLRPDGGGFATTSAVAAGEAATLPLVGISPGLVPDDATQAVVPEVPAGAVGGVVWLDFRPGGGGEAGRVDDGEVGLPGARVEAVDAGGSVVGRATTDERGSFVLEDVTGPATLRLAPTTFREPFRGVRWLGPALVTPAVIGAYVWIWAGFAMVVIAAGLAAIPREALEAARVDGANEWQVFRRVTVPLLAPVLLVVLVTLVINVLKVFDLVLVIPPGSVQDDANVLALEMWRVSFGGARDQGLGSALGVLLFALVLPAMAFNIRRFRQEGA